MKDYVNVSYFHFQWFLKWPKLPKDLWNIRQTSTCIYEQLKTTKLPMNDDVYVYFFFFSMVFKREENYQNTLEKIFKQVQAYINFQKLLNYQWMMMYMFKISFFNGFQKWSKLPKYLWNNLQASTCIYDFTMDVLKIAKLPTPTYHSTLIYLRRITW